MLKPMLFTGKKPSFKKEMSEFEIRGIENYLEDAFDPGFVERLGLAYTSSSNYALLGACNEELSIVTDEEVSDPINHFALSDNNILYAVCNDKDEKESIWRIN